MLQGSVVWPEGTTSGQAIQTGPPCKGGSAVDERPPSRLLAQFLLYRCLRFRCTEGGQLRRGVLVGACC